MRNLKEEIAFLAKDGESNKFLLAVLAWHGARSLNTQNTQGLSRALSINQILEPIENHSVSLPKMIRDVIVTFRQYGFLNEESST